MAGAEPSWDLYRTFLAVVRQGSFSAASRHLMLRQPTVGRQIDTLETMLGTKLFLRSPRGLVPTDAARALVPLAEDMAATAGAVVRNLSGEATDEAGIVRLAAGEFVGHEVVPPILAGFARRYPRITLELALSNRNENLLRREVDIAIRMMRPTQDAVVARRIGVVTIGLFAHRRYVETFGTMRDFADRARHRLIGFDSDMHVLQTTGGLAARLSREDFTFRCDSTSAQMAALRAGVGITACHTLIARRDPDLVAILPDQVRFEREFWLAMHEDARETSRIRLLYDHLACGLAAYVAGEPDPP